MASTCLASFSSIHRNGIGFRIGLLPGAVFGTRNNMVTRPPDACEPGHILAIIYATFRKIQGFWTDFGKPLATIC
jgi:hypothetical protein